MSVNALSNAPACGNPDWLPEGEWPELDELRAEHVRLLELLSANAADARAVRARFEQEDAGRAAAIEQRTQGRDVKLPTLTPEPERAAALAPFGQQGRSIRAALDELCQKVLDTCEQRSADWFTGLDEQEDELRREITEAQARIDAALGAMSLHRSKRTWLFRTAGHRWSSPRLRAIPFPREAGARLTVQEAMAPIEPDRPAPEQADASADAVGYRSDVSGPQPIGHVNVAT